jgi:hypothetical protein
LIAISAVSGVALSMGFPTRGPKLDLHSIAAGSLAGSRQLPSLAALGTPVLLTAVKGQYLLNAPAYLQFQASTSLVSVANLVAPIGLLSAGLVAVHQKALGWFSFAAISICLFGYSTRLFAVAPLLFLLGNWLGGWRIPKPKLLLASLAAILLLPVPLFTRGLTQHGLIPYGSELLRDPLAPYGGDPMLQSIGNVGLSLPLAQFVADRVPNIPTEAYMASLDPWLAQHGAWQLWGPLLRIHLYVPFSMLGEWANQGLLFVFLAFFVWGLVVRLSISLIAQFAGSSIVNLVFLLAFALANLSVLYCLQYNTRSVSRILWILLFLGVATGLLGLVHSLLGRRKALVRSQDGRGISVASQEPEDAQ